MQERAEGEVEPGAGRSNSAKPARNVGGILTVTSPTMGRKRTRLAQQSGKGCPQKGPGLGPVAL